MGRCKGTVPGGGVYYFQLVIVRKCVGKVEDRVSPTHFQTNTDQVGVSLLFLPWGNLWERRAEGVTPYGFTAHGGPPLL